MRNAGRAAGRAVMALAAAAALVAALWLAPGDGEGERQPGREDAAVPDIPMDVQRRRIRVEVLNGAGDAGAAARVTERLRSAGFDVKTYGNAAAFGHAETLVLDRSGRADAAAAVARELGGAELRADLDSALHLDATVVLGADWRARLATEP
ncbi:MAG: LytR C-terminal domain-containing protein [Gemmatimonadota bacterium]|nr:LytR C-terminal domain-containing protein [Gemmatimonadota bacterium]